MSKRIQGSPNESIRKINKTGTYSYYITIPKSLIQEMRWKEKQQVVVKRLGKRLFIEDGKG